MFTIYRARTAAQPRVSILRRIRAALELRRQRQHLTELDDHMLRDIGLTAEQVHAEADQPIWHAPHHWLLNQR
jgi:uncharacterized protein YjiS (DUF1127 family)